VEYYSSKSRDEVSYIDSAPSRIYIDHREHAERLKQALHTEFGFTIFEKQLKIGDYIICPDTTIERKTTKDFCISILDGRLFSQAYKLARFCDNPIIIIEGKSFTKDIDLQISLEAIKGALITIAQTFHLPVLRTKDEQDTAWYINQLSIQRQRVGQHKGPLSAYNPKKKQTKKEYILRAFPGIGQKMARTLLEEFGSITNIINASKEDLTKIHGLGPKTIEQMFNVIKESHAIYRSDKH